MTIVTSRISRRLGRPRLGRTPARMAALAVAVLGLLLAPAMPAMADGNHHTHSAKCKDKHHTGDSARGADGAHGARGADGAHGTRGADGADGKGSSQVNWGGGSKGTKDFPGGNDFSGPNGIDMDRWIQGVGTNGTAGNIGAAVDLANLSVTAGEFGKHDCKDIIARHDKDSWRFGVSAGAIVSIKAKFADSTGKIHTVTGAGSKDAASADASVVISTGKAGLKLVGGSATVVGAKASVTLELLSTCPAKSKGDKPKPVVEPSKQVPTEQPTKVADQQALPVTGSALTWYLLAAALMIALGVVSVLAVRRRAHQSL